MREREICEMVDQKNEGKIGKNMFIEKKETRDKITKIKPRNFLYFIKLDDLQTTLLTFYKIIFLSQLTTTSIICLSQSTMSCDI